MQSLARMPLCTSRVWIDAGTSSSTVARIIALGLAEDGAAVGSYIDGVVSRGRARHKDDDSERALARLCHDATLDYVVSDRPLDTWRLRVASEPRSGAGGALGPCVVSMGTGRAHSTHVSVALERGWIVEQGGARLVPLADTSYVRGPARACAVPRLIGAAAALRELGVSVDAVRRALRLFDPCVHDGGSGTVWRVRGLSVWLERGVPSDLEMYAVAASRRPLFARALVLGGAPLETRAAVNVARRFDRVFLVTPRAGAERDQSLAFADALARRTHVILGLDEASLIAEAIETAPARHGVVVVSPDLEAALDVVVELGGTRIATPEVEPHPRVRRLTFSVAPALDGARRLPRV